MVKVTCKYCKEKIDKKDALQIIELEKKNNSYFCDNQHHQLFTNDNELKLKQKEIEQLQKQQFNELDIYIASEILLYDVGQITPVFLKKRIKNLAKNYDYEVIKLCFELVKQDLNYYVKTKEFTNEQHLVNYVMVVIENNINNAYKMWKRKKQIESEQKKLERNNTIDQVVITPLIANKQKNNDISMFLTEDDL